jgi:hypothetical protein
MFADSERYRAVNRLASAQDTIEVRTYPAASFMTLPLSRRDHAPAARSCSEPIEPASDLRCGKPTSWMRRDRCKSCVQPIEFDVIAIGKLIKDP